MNLNKLIIPKPIAIPSDYLRGQAEAAQYAHVAPRTISDWQARRIIPFIKVSPKCVLFKKSEIDKALLRYEVKAV